MSDGFGRIWLLCRFAFGSELGCRFLSPILFHVHGRFRQVGASISEELLILGCLLLSDGLLLVRSRCEFLTKQCGEESHRRMNWIPGRY